MTSVLIKGRKGEDRENRRSPCEDKGRVDSNAATSRETLGITKSWDRKHSPLEPLEGAWHS